MRIKIVKVALCYDEHGWFFVSGVRPDFSPPNELYHLIGQGSREGVERMKQALVREAQADDRKIHPDYRAVKTVDFDDQKVAV